MNIVGYDPSSSPRAKELGVEMVAKARGLLPHVDYLTVHTPLTDETREPARPRRNAQNAQGGAIDQLRPRRHLRRGRVVEGLKTG